MSCNCPTSHIFPDDNTTCDGCSSCSQKCHEIVDTLAEVSQFRNAYVTVRDENAVYHVDEVGNAVCVGRQILYIANYTPVTGAYKSTVVYDTVNGIIYIFDPDGNYGESVEKSYVDDAVATGGLTPVSDLVRLNAVQALTNKDIQSGTIGSAVDVTEILKKVYPVGAIYISVIATNPATVLGFGTWNAFATGRTIVGVDPAQTEFNTVQKLGGEKIHVLSVAELPAHRHFVAALNTVTSPLALGATNQVAANRDDPGAGDFRYAMDNGGTAVEATIGRTSSTGDDGAHNNLQPFITTYMFRRTA